MVNRKRVKIDIFVFENVRFWYSAANIVMEVTWGLIGASGGSKFLKFGVIFSYNFFQKNFVSTFEGSIEVFKSIFHFVIECPIQKTELSKVKTLATQCGVRKSQKSGLNIFSDFFWEWIFHEIQNYWDSGRAATKITEHACK